MKYIIIPMFIVFMFLNTFMIIPTNSIAVPGFTYTEYLIPNRTLDSELHMADGNFNATYTAVDGNPGLATATYWNYNNSYLYWGNVSSKFDTDCDIGTGRAVFHLSEPTGVSPTGYWQISITGWARFICWPSWTDVDGVAVADAPDIYHKWNLGIGYTTVNNGNFVAHYQMPSTNGWGLSGGTPWDTPQFHRPSTGTEWADIGNNTLVNRAWSTSEVSRMVAICDMTLDYAVYDSALTASGPIALALCGIQVAIAPSPYTYEESEIISGQENMFLGDIFYYLLAFFAILMLSLVVSYNTRTHIFYSNTFMISLGIGFLILVWIPVVPDYFIVIAIVIFGMVLFKDKIMPDNIGGDI